jgi:hypothetical protein
MDDVAADGAEVGASLDHGYVCEAERQTWKEKIF